MALAADPNDFEELTSDIEREAQAEGPAAVRELRDLQGKYRLAELELVIERGLTTFIEVGQALLEIRDSRLYPHDTFDSYCKERWGWGRTRAEQMITAAKVTSELSGVTNVTPRNEAQARELAPLKDDPDELAEVWQELQEEHGDKLTASVVKDAVQRRMRSLGKREDHQRLPVVEPPTGKYRCIVIDPPWPMQKIEREVRPNQSAELDYPVMSLEEIGALPVAELAVEEGCHVYLWVTHRFLPAGLDLFEQWGVKYQCSMTWVKNVGITPFSWMYDTEHVLFGRIGSLNLDQLGLRLSFDAPVTKHSEKPEVFYERVVQASPGPRLEMFARKPREGFTVWGNEVAGLAS